jgi:hypothetical protein
MTAFLAWGLLHSTLALGQEPPNPLQEERERQAVAAIEKLNGFVSRDDKAPGEPVVSVSFQQPIRDADLKLLEALPKLKWLLILEGRITDAGLAILATLPNLEYLSIRNSPITDAGTESLVGRHHLRTVEFVATQVTSAGTARLKDGLPYALIRVKQQVEVGREHNIPVCVYVVPALILLVGFGLAIGLLRSKCERIQQRRWVSKGAVVATAVAMVGAALIYFSPRSDPVQNGDAAEFWLHVTRLDVGVQEPRHSMGSFYLPRDGWCIYYRQGFHGSDLYRVRNEEVAALFPKVVERLEKAPPGILNPDVENGYRAWAEPGSGPKDFANFLSKVQQARLKRIEKNNPRLYDEIRTEDYFGLRWERARRYYWNIIFEFAFFTSLIVWAAWPWLRQSGRFRWALHITLLPILFVLPFWLGYAQFSFTSVGPVGGVIYPYLVMICRGLPWTSIDTVIVRNLPPILEPLSQESGRILSLTYFGAPGPVAVATLGLAAGLLVFFAKTWLDRECIKNSRHPDSAESTEKKDFARS